MLRPILRPMPNLRASAKRTASDTGKTVPARSRALKNLGQPEGASVISERSPKKRRNKAATASNRPSPQLTTAETASDVFNGDAKYRHEDLLSPDDPPRLREYKNSFVSQLIVIAAGQQAIFIDPLSPRSVAHLLPPRSHSRCLLKTLDGKQSTQKPDQGQTGNRAPAEYRDRPERWRPLALTGVPHASFYQTMTDKNDSVIAPGLEYETATLLVLKKRSSRLIHLD